MQNFIMVAAFIALGIGLQRLRVVPQKAPYFVNMIAIYVCVPAIILLNAPKIVLNRDSLAAALIPWVLLALSAGLVLAGAKLWGWSRSVTGALLLVVPLGNTSFLGVPVVRSFFGAAGLPHLIIYDQLGTTLIFGTYGSLILALYGEDETLSVPAVIRRMVLFPPTLALAAGLLLQGWTYPHWFTAILTGVAAPLVPMVMTAIGVQMRLSLPKHLAAPVGLGLLIKMLAAPLLVLAVCRLVHMEGLSVGVSVMEAGMPPMMTAGALAVVAGLEAELAIALVGIGIICSFGSLPALYWLVSL